MLEDVNEVCNDFLIEDCKRKIIPICLSAIHASSLVYLLNLKCAQLFQLVLYCKRLGHFVVATQSQFELVHNKCDQLIALYFGHKEMLEFFDASHHKLRDFSEQRPLKTMPYDNYTARK